jgi:hypothetical protein
MQSIEYDYLQGSIKTLLYYKKLADETFSRLSEKDFYYQTATENNTIAIIIQHLSGNMFSRWTNFLTSDGEKEWRKRDEEFEATTLSKADLLHLWEQGWACCINAIQQLSPADLTKTITIRNEPLTVINAINRQLAHYPYHVGQIIFIAKTILDSKFQSLSIPKKPRNTKL